MRSLVQCCHMKSFDETETLVSVLLCVLVSKGTLYRFKLQLALSAMGRL